MPFSAVVLWIGVLAGSFSPAGTQQGGTPAPEELVPYLRARSVVDFSPGELIELMPELKRIDFAQSQDLLTPILGKVSANVDVFFADYPNTSALEDVYQEREEPGGVANEYLKRRFYYIISARNSDDELGFEEYRTDLKNELFNPVELRGAYLLTSGHASAPLHFHTRLRAGCRFRYLGREQAKRRAHVVAFAQDAEKTRTWGTISLLGNEAVVLEQGAVWVDPDSYQILRMRSDLLAPRSDIGLEQHTTIIEFGEVSFEGALRKLWLPREVQLVLRFKGWKFRNRHRYSQYRLFSVQTIDGPKQIRPKP